ncbi:UPF0182 family protein [Nocardioides sp. HM23]|uniref:UPF0182 family membrane protein n=1 Tax=Nocardioides bizhenqiangii TaxID=3095076 RepID=UPI002ACAD7D9|nr:UPF0182 family protein [Nocardioides sp. HM23]MDZ5621145.1 UPF0182 family protein [Nocardioides sp. HM23]
MSDLFDDEPGDVETRRPGSRARALVITGVVLVVGFFALTTFATIYTDRLWYDEVGYGQVFSTMLWTRIGLFLVFGLFMAAAVAVNMYLAYRFRPLFRIPGGDGSVDRYRDAVTPIRTWLLAGVATVVGIFAGTSALGNWRTYLLWRHSQPFDQKDAYFDKDISFYVFSLPWWHYVVDFVMAAAVVAILATAVVHYLYGGIRLQVQHDRLSGAAQVQFSVLLGIFVLAKGVDYYLDRFDLVTNDNSLFTGMNYTGENALLPARNILMGVALICAVLFFLNIWRRTWQLPSVGLALLVLSAILLGMIWPAIVQNFQVKPTEADKEETYIQENIDATTQAYDIADVESEDYQAIPDESAIPDDARALAALQSQLDQVPVVDPKQVRETFEQTQQPQVYYSVAPVLDVDRYKLTDPESGQVVETPLVLGVRELDQDEIADRNWSNLHTVYTHGEGIIAAYANEVPATGDSGNIRWAEGIDSDDNVFTEQEGFEPRVYYGEQSPEYSVVGKSSEDADDVELGMNSADEEEEQATTYDGDGGVDVGSTFRQLMYAVKFGETNFLLSGRVNGSSRVLYNRDPQTRVEKVAPWLTVDGDPYPAVIDGRIQWILDGYTTTDRYPNSQRESFESMIDDSLQDDTGLQTIPTDEINYMRSAVKATVDAYDGTVTLYAWDEEDPILRTWMSAFPGTVKPRAEIPDPLMEHLRYPEDLFKVQRYQLARYHVTDASDFYEGSERWEVPADPEQTGALQPPYRVFTGTTATDSGQWSLTSVFVPRGKGNLASFVSVDSDIDANTAEEYDSFGQIQVLNVSDANADGPGQVANEMQQDEGVSDTLQQFRVQGATPPVFGNLLTVPLSSGLINIQPVYAVRPGATSSFPILQYVIVRYGADVGIGRDIPLALADALGLEAQDDENDNGQNPGDNNGQNNGQGPGGQPGEEQTPEERIAELLQDASDLFDRAEEAQSRNDTAEWAELLEQAEEKVRQALTISAQRDGGDQPGDQPTEPTDESTGE